MRGNATVTVNSDADPLLPGKLIYPTLNIVKDYFRGLRVKPPLASLGAKLVAFFARPNSRRDRGKMAKIATRDSVPGAV